MRILAFAYACEPDKGSEPEAGWMWARLLARLGETWVITRSNNADAIQQGLSKIPEAKALHFVYVDPPSWLTFWKRGQRGIRTFYLLWQIVALKHAMRLHREKPFDVAWHVTLANAWLGSVAALIPVRFVYGPIGGGVATRWSLVSDLGVRGTGYEVLRNSVRWLGRYLNPLARLAWRRATLILAQNPETRNWLPPSTRDRTLIVPNVLIEGVSERQSRQRSAIALGVGRLLPLKGWALALRALRLAPQWQLVIMGHGRDKRRLQALAAHYGLIGRVEFRGMRPREQVIESLKTEAEVLIFPSYHDEAGWAVVESLAQGIPVVCLNLGGPPLLAGKAGVAVKALGPEETARALARALDQARRISPDTCLQRAADFSLGARAEQVARLLAERGIVSGARL